MTSYESRNNPLFLRNAYFSDNVWDIPCIEKQDLSLQHALQPRKRSLYSSSTKYGRSEKNVFGPDGKPVTKMTWQEFTAWQSWDEFPERATDPPLTQDCVFWLRGRQYIITGVGGGKAILTYPEWETVAASKNLLQLLTEPVWQGKSFKDLLTEILFT